MNLYWLSRDGGQTEGPFADEQLLAMWRSGAITAAAQVCLQGTDDWRSVLDEIRAVEGEKAPVKRGHATWEGERALAAVRKSGARKSEGVALVLSFLLPGLGHLYAVEVWQGLAVLVLVCLFMTMAIQSSENGGLAVIIAGVIWLLALIDAPRAVRRYNEQN